MNTKPKTVEEIYISVDVEADGRIPAVNSLMALGAVVAGYRTKSGELVKVDPSLPSARFYAELKPTAEDWDPEAIAVGVLKNYDNSVEDPTGQLKRNHLKEFGQEASVAMEAFTAWVREQTEFYNARAAIFMGYPDVYDWTWTYWYMIAFTKGGSPFGHGRSISIKTAYAAKTDTATVNSVKGKIPKYLHSKLPHTHLAVDDAAEQGQLGMNILAIAQPTWHVISHNRGSDIVLRGPYTFQEASRMKESVQKSYPSYTVEVKESAK